MKIKKSSIAVLAVFFLIFAVILAFIFSKAIKVAPAEESTTKQIALTTRDYVDSYAQEEEEETEEDLTADDGRIKVACIGDSITYGYGIDNRKENCYPAKLGKFLGKKYRVVNFGASGRTAMLSADKPYMLEEKFENSKLFAPDIVIIMLGTNDTKSINWDSTKFFNDYQKLIESYKSLSTFPKIYVLTPTPLFLEEDKETYPNEAVLKTQAIPLIKMAASKEEAEVIDVYALFENKSYLLADGCHPNEYGAEALAKIVYGEISTVK